MDDQNISKKLALLGQLRASFAAALPSRLDALDACWRKAETAGAWGDAHAELLRLAHSMAGSAGTFDFTRVGEKARELEEALLSLSLKAGPLTPEQNAQVTDLLESLGELALAGADGETTLSSANVNSYIAMDVLPDNRHIVLIEDDKALAQIVKAQLGMFSWEVSSFSSAKEARAVLAGPRPAAVIVDVNLPDGPMAGLQLLRQLENTEGFKVPHLVISSRNDWEARLAAVRSGAAAYLVKPIDIPSLVELLDRITTKSIPAPVRVLLLDDDELLAQHYALIFETAGMNPMTINHPSRVLDAMAEHQPEIVLLDLYMPECTGIDVMKVIRQNPQYVSVPIVFLSSETSLDHQQMAMQTGAEEFLQKSLSDAHLVNAITVRAMRFRSLASLIREDSLTGLLNHIAFKLRLETEIARSRRADEPLSLVMLDIDHFKRVNDIHGHPQGDRVIKSLAQLLRTRLRKTDIIGRYGGEEFVVAMPNTLPSLAKTILDELRASFGTLQFESPQGQFACSFSAGVAATTLMEDPASLNIAADNALYHAKQSGRDRVELFDPSKTSASAS